MKVKIKADYIDNVNEYRRAVGQVIRIPYSEDADYLIRFPTGEIEPFARHEFEVVV